MEPQDLHCLWAQRELNKLRVEPPDLHCLWAQRELNKLRMEEGAPRLALPMGPK
ncbi:hypothetical protein AVEN_7078-1, partial [Araneus ventricosus]